MNWNIYKGIISIFILIPLIFAQEEISFSVLEGDISILKDNKELKHLSLYNSDFTQEHVNGLCDLNNLEKLTLARSISFKDGVNFECLKNLKIKHLIIEFDNRPKEYLKYFQNLETLFIQPVNSFYQVLDPVNIYQEDLESIIAMKNLKQLELYFIQLNEVDFEAITDTSNVSILKYHSYNSFPLTPNFFKIFSQVEELFIANHNFNQQEADGLKTLKNLKDISLYNINKPCYEYENDEYVKLDFGFFIYNNIVNKVKQGPIYEFFKNNCMLVKPSITQEDINKLCNSNILETINLDSPIEEGINFECFRDFEIKHLNITAEERPKELLQNFPNLETLVINPVNTFYQEEFENIVGMKNLKNLTLNTIDHIDFEAITDSSNIRRLDLSNYKGIPLTPNFFKIFSQLEEFYSTYHVFTQQEVDGFKTLKNLKKIYLYSGDCDEIELDFGSLKNILKFDSDYFRYGFISRCIRGDGIQENKTYTYIYNANKNKCLHFNRKGDGLTLGDCNDNPEYILWANNYGYGVIPFAANPACCLVSNGISCGEPCMFDHKTSRLCTSGNKIRPAASYTCSDTCLGSSDDDSNKLVWSKCDDNNPNQTWYFNIWDPSVVIKETAFVYFYNAFKNVCIQTDGFSVTTGSCDFTTDDTLWEIPNSHKGYYRSKAYPEKCLSIVDGVVSLKECDEDTTLYLDGNFIRSPSSKDHCIASSKSGQTLEYVESCDMNDTDHFWYVNIWTPDTE